MMQALRTAQAQSALSQQAFGERAGISTVSLSNGLVTDDRHLNAAAGCRTLTQASIALTVQANRPIDPEGLVWRPLRTAAAASARGGWSLGAPIGPAMRWPGCGDWTSGVTADGRFTICVTIRSP